ncbi:hypothetical protein EMCRGX_G022765 [Ephydatia muelleri]
MVVRKPIVKEPNDQENVPALVADLSVSSVRHPQATTFFDVRVVDSDAKYYVHCDVGAVNLSSTKKQKYSQAAEIINASFTPFVVTVDGGSRVKWRTKPSNPFGNGSVAAQVTEARKHQANDPKCSELGWVCVPMVAESYGAWSEEASAIISSIATSMCKPKLVVLNDIYGSLNVHLVRANARIAPPV